MPTITVAVPDELKKEMDEMRMINWSEVARLAFREKLEQLHILKSITSKSKLSDKDALELGKEINKTLGKRYETGR